MEIIFVYLLPLAIGIPPPATEKFPPTLSIPGFRI
ncbi:hypothetical protein EZS27_037194 [termite gut metagenome]|uniref:Uncharacterized protein n=1 Tax=termite gut metagenome TaxID=433724 RepID=A0A5J4PSK0_9ZZZZ